MLFRGISVSLRSVLRSSFAACFVSMGAVLMMGAPAVAGPILTENLFGGPGNVTALDTVFNTTTGGVSKESYGVEGLARLSGQQIRINALTGASPGTFTFSVDKNTSFNWESGRTYNFTESYSGDATKKLSVSFTDTVTSTTYNIDSTGFPYNVTFGGVKSLVFRMTTPQGGTSTATSSSVELKNLKLDSTSFSNVITVNSSAAERYGNYFAIHDYNFTNAWTLSGSVTLTWTGNAPTNSSYGFQIKGIQNDPFTSTVPEPSTLATAALSAVGGLVFVRRRRTTVA